MKKQEKALLDQLDHFYQETNRAAAYLYGVAGMDYWFARNPAALSRANQNPTFWISARHAMHESLFLALGRIFDTGSRNNAAALVQSISTNLHMFSRVQLETRKLTGRRVRPDWLDAYVAQSYEPTIVDVRRLKKWLGTVRKHYERTYKPIRHKVIAHSELIDEDDISALYSGTRVRELKAIVGSLLAIHAEIISLYDNGRHSRQSARKFALLRHRMGEVPSTKSTVIDRTLTNCRCLFGN